MDTKIPKEIIDRGDDAISEWVAGTSCSGVQPLNEAKLLILGDGGVGKTSLARRLCGNSYDSDSLSTRGVDVSSLDGEIGGQRFTLNLWDFGGQEIMHATHQIFLSRRSIYIIVLSARAESEPYYWLENARAFGGNSPVLVVVNQVDQHGSFEIDKYRLKQEFPEILGFHKTSCKTGHGIASLQEAIWIAVRSLPHFRSDIPASWMQVRQRLDTVNREYVDEDDFSAICYEEGISKHAEQSALLSFLNDLGIVVYFPEVALQVLKPAWVTSAIYRIINSDLLHRSKGVLEISSVKEILTNDGSSIQYNANERRAILEIMKRFELCYDEVPNVSVLFPGHLPVQQPLFKFDTENAVHLRFDFAFLPSSIFSRILVRLQTHLDYEHRWRAGALASSRLFEARILCHLNKQRNYLQAWVQGPESWKLTNLFCKQVIDVTENLHGFEVHPVVPCCCDLCATARQPNFHYLHSLVARLEDGARFVVCELSDQPVGLDKLLPRHPLLSTAWSANIVFVSYSSKDTEIVAKIVSDIRSKGIPYWLDSENIYPGDSVSEKLNEGLDKASILLACISNNQLRSGWARAEYGGALSVFHSDGGKKVIPLILDNMENSDIPGVLRDLKAVRLSDRKQYTDLLHRLASN